MGESADLSKAGAPPLVSIVVPVWNGEAVIGRCLEAIGRQTYPRDRMQVLVVDNGSSDRTAEIVATFAFATLLREDEPSSYRARNAGLRAAAGEYVAFTDADCAPEPDWLAAGVEAALEHPEAGIIAGAIEFIDSATPSACERYDRLFGGFNQERNAAEGFCVTANWLSRREALLAHGGFRDDLKSVGDAELSRRIHAAGKKVRFAPRMRVRHPPRTELREQVSRSVRIVGGRWSRDRAHRGLPEWAWILSREAAGCVRRAALTRSFALADKVQVSGVALVLYAAGMAEIVRLAAGGAPRRA
ncbi:MAG: glycosyltransferase family 2 protein [Hyphomonadaceae bacterium]|nr:glycosyltransferase family 2 protein [Hyphomonadaceae bacterium]